MSFAIVLTCLLATFDVVHAQDRAVSITPATAGITFPARRPQGAVVVPPDFVGVGFETANFNNYTNLFSQNLINSIAKRVSAPLVIRIGGTTGDNLHYNPAQKANATCSDGPDCVYSSGSHFVIGPSYFDGFKSFKPHKVSFQAPLGGTLNITNALDFTTNAYKTLTRARVAAVAIGNEVEGYEATPQDYVSDAIKLETNITKTLGLSGNDAKIFEVLDLASGQVDAGSWQLPAAFNAGLDSNGQTSVAAEHYYQIDGQDMLSKPDYTPANLQKLLMNHGAITTKFTKYVNAINYLKGNASFSSIKYVLSETGSALGPPASFANSFGACLWNVDFHLYAMSVGVARVAATGRPTAQHGLWIPNPVPGHTAPLVYANYYALPLVADFISNSTAAQSVIEQSLKSDNFSAYAMYSGDTLARVALVNLRVWPSDPKATDEPRGNTTFPVSVPSGTSSVRVRRLHADKGAFAQGYDVDRSEVITWAGEQWSYALDDGNGHRTGQVDEAVSVTSGVANVLVPDSEAVIVYI